MFAKKVMGNLTPVSKPGGKEAVTFKDKVTGCPLMITSVLRILRFFLFRTLFAFFCLNTLSVTHHTLFLSFFGILDGTHHLYNVAVMGQA